METRDFILFKTFGLLVKKGYNGVSITEIQQITGMARGLLYHYFDNQQQLFQVAAVTFLEKWDFWEREKVKDLSVPELIVYAVEHYSHISRKWGKLLGKGEILPEVVLFWAELRRHSPGFDEQCRKIEENRFAVWKTALLNSFAREELRSGLNIESLTRHLVYLQDGVLSGKIPEKDPSGVVYWLEKVLTDFFEIIRR